jgi:dihydrofolate reductase/thymidylate synthase
MKSFNVIFSISSNGGIGYNNKLPWNFSTDLRYFREITKRVPYLLNLQNIVIMGRNTFESLPESNKPLEGRINIVISKNMKEKIEKKYKSVIVCDSFISAINRIQTIKHYNAWVIGGRTIYNQAFKHSLLHKIYYNVIYPTREMDMFLCDTYLKLPSLSNIVTSKKGNIEFNVCKIYDNEIKYCSLLSDILTNGSMKEGRNGNVLTLFSKHIKLNVEKSFPLITGKKMFWRGIVEELLFFIKGNTNTKLLEDKKINIWKLNTNKDFLNSRKLNYEEGDMGPMYGFLWRHYGSLYKGCDEKYDGKGIDQLQLLIDGIKQNPNSRRHLLTTYDPSIVNEGVLYPCHSIVLQFYVEENKYIHMKMYQRSADMFLGVPFNIASSTLLLYIIGKLTKLIPKYVTITFGDVHIYEEHIDCVKTLLKRDTHKEPTVTIPDFNSLEEVEKSIFSDYKLHNYKSEPSLKARMIA